MTAIIAFGEGTLGAGVSPAFTQMALAVGAGLFVVTLILILERTKL